MKYIAKMMLALLASITLAVPAFAWDWSASGSASARFYNGSYTPSADNASATKNSPAARSFNDMDHAGSVAINASHTDGDTSTSFSIGLDHDDGAITKAYSISGSKKVGDWTASASYTLTEYSSGNSDSDDSDVGEGSDGEDALVTLTDGSNTYKLGKAAHLSTGTMGPSTIFMNAHTDSSGYEGGGGADTGSFNGFSVGMGMGEVAITFAIQMDKDTKILGNRAWDDELGGDGSDAGDNDQPWDNGTDAYDTMAYGLNIAGTAGTIGYTATITSGSIGCDGAVNGVSGTDPVCKDWSVSSSSTAFGVSMDMGGMAPFLSYASRSYKRAVGAGAANESDSKYNVMSLGLNGTSGDLAYSVVYDSTTASRTSGVAKTEGTESALHLGSDDDSGATALSIGVSQAIGAVTMTAGISQQLSRDALLEGDTADTYAKASNGSSLMMYGASLAYSF